MNRRIVFLLLLILIIVGAGAALVLLQDSGGGDGSPEGTEVAQVDDDRDDDVDVTLPPTATPIPRVEVVVALQDIRRGVRIQPNMVQVIRFPEEFVPISAFQSVEEVVGGIARTEIYREELILSSKVVPDLTGLAAAGSDAAAVLPPNRVAVAIPIDRLTSVGYAIQPGDRVDVITSMLFVDVDQQFQTLLPNITRFVTFEPSEDNPDIIVLGFGDSGRGEFDTVNIRSDSLGGARFETVMYEPSEVQQRPRLTTQTTIQDALVIWVGTFPSDGSMFGATATPFATATPIPDETTGGTNDDGTSVEVTPEAVVPPDIVTLAVSPQEAVELTWFVEAGLPLTFALRSASSTSLQETNAVTLNYVMNRFNIRVPERASYSLEPAIRSIRSIDVGNRIELYDANQQRDTEQNTNNDEEETNTEGN